MRKIAVVAVALALFAACASSRPASTYDAAAGIVADDPAAPVPTPVMVADSHAADPNAASAVAPSGGSGGEVPDAVAAGGEAAEAATEKRSPWHDFAIRFAGMIIADMNTRLRIDSDIGVNPEVRLEDLLGFDSTGQIFRLDAYYRFNRSHRLDFAYYDIQRDSKAVIDEEIDFGEDTFPVNAEVKSKLGTRIFKLNYWWNFVAQEDWEMGVGAGLHWMSLDARFSADAVIGDDGQEVPLEVDIKETLQQELPLPLLGFRIAGAPHPRVRVEYALQLLYAKLGDFEGGILDMMLGVDWDFLDFMGAGLAWNTFIIDVDGTNKSLDWNLRYDYNALLASLYFYF
jgi:hypothetical protein